MQPQAMEDATFVTYGWHRLMGTSGCCQQRVFLALNSVHLHPEKRPHVPPFLPPPKKGKKLFGDWFSVGSLKRSFMFIFRMALWTVASIYHAPPPALPHLSSTLKT